MTLQIFFNMAAALVVGLIPTFVVMYISRDHNGEWF